MNRLSRLATARPRRVLVAVLAFVLVAGVLGGPVAGSLRDSGGFTAEDSNSQRALDRIEKLTGRAAAPGVVLITPRGEAAALRPELARLPGVATVDVGPPSRDGKTTYLAATLRANTDTDATLGAVDARFGNERGVLIGGAEFADRQVGDSVSEDLGRAELLAFPVLLLLSLLFFRRRAALLPLAVGMTTVLGTFLVLAGINEAYGLSIFALNLVIGLGLGLAIDYTLFLVTRFREQLDAGDEVGDAVRTTLHTAGRTVAYSAVTVAVSLLTLVLFPLNFLQSMGIAGAVVALLAAVASLIITPALFAIWGRKLVVPARTRGAGNWYRLAHGVMARPGRIAVATALLMLVVAAPALRAHWTPVDSSVIPKSQSARTVADRLDDDFADRTQPLTVVTGDQIRQVRPVGLPASERTQQQVRDIRAQQPDALVAGAAARFVDQQDAISSRLLPAGVLLAVLIFAVLWLMTGSLLLPIKAILMNVLTVGASLGVLTLVFQDGRFAGLLNYTPNGGVEPTDFLVAAALIFALSTDYGVFLLGRIKEARATAGSEREAVAVGLERTGAVVTAAAILLAVAIGAFVTSSISFIQQIGVASATGVLLDAFVVRTFLVPSLMALLGRWNWWSPRPLARLHARVGISESSAASPAHAAA